MINKVMLAAVQQQRLTIRENVTKGAAEAAAAADKADKDALADIEARRQRWITSLTDMGKDEVSKAAASANTSLLRLRGNDNAAEIAEIRQHAEEVKKARTKAAEDLIATSKLQGFPADQVRANARDANQQTDFDANAQVAQKQKESSLRLHDMQSEAHVMELKNARNFAAAELEQINRSYDDKIAAAKSGEERLALQRQKAAATTGAALDAINKRANEEMGLKESPLEKYREEMDQLVKEINSGAIKDESLADKIAAGFQDEYRNSLKVELYQATQQSFRRFNTGELQTPHIASENDKVLDISKDSLTEQKKQTKELQSLNSSISKFKSLDWTRVAAP